MYTMLHLTSTKGQDMWVVKKFEAGGSPKGGWTTPDAFKLHAVYDNGGDFARFGDEMRLRNIRKEAVGTHLEERCVQYEEIQVTVAELRKWIDRANRSNCLNKERTT